jgi:alpha,alpha-trehalase
MHTPTTRSAKPEVRHLKSKKSVLFSAIVLTCATIFISPPTHSDPAPDDNGLAPIRAYISTTWDTLTRSMNECKSVIDTKVAGRSVIYIPADFPEPTVLKNLQKECQVDVTPLPAVIHHPGEVDANSLNPPGLLYLENKYVVPGGRFNEMYGWDSYFIIRGLVEDHRVELARGMVENFFFEIEHYGNILNANRSYYLSRMQPPFLTSEIFSVYNAEKSGGNEDKKWLAHAYEIASKDHDMWTVAPHLAGDTGLARYFDRGDGPSPESIKDETGHYRDVAAFFLRHPELDDNYLVRKDSGKTTPQTFGRQYSVRVCDTAQDSSSAVAKESEAAPGCSTAEDVALSASFYKGDRSMRESGYDIAFRFGPYGAGTQNFAPNCLNALLYKAEKDLQQMAEILGRPDEAKKWARVAEDRKAAMNKYLWDEKQGIFTDYNFEKRQLSTYPYITAFVPLWAGVATPEQAKSIMKTLPTFEQPGGLVMSPTESGGQWDFPYAWAPNQLMAIEGMRRYNFTDDANRNAYKFLSDVAENFRRDGTIREKYNAVTRSDETNVTAGYHVNLIGFGWTNGVFLTLLRDLPKSEVARLSAEQSTSPQAPPKTPN